MTFDEYMKETRRTRVSADIEEEILNGALGLAGEAGEVVEMIKKWRFHGLSLDNALLRKELGDVLWYLSRLADATQGEFDGVAADNIKKLEKRYPRGFEQGGGIRDEEKEEEVRG